MIQEQKLQYRIAEMAAERDKAFLGVGYTISTADLLRQICAVLHGIMLNENTLSADRVAAAEALFRINFGEGSPIDLIRVSQ